MKSYGLSAPTQSQIVNRCRSRGDRIRFSRSVCSPIRCVVSVLTLRPSAFCIENVRALEKPFASRPVAAGQDTELWLSNQTDINR